MIEWLIDWTIVELSEWLIDWLIDWLIIIDRFSLAINQTDLACSPAYEMFGFPDAWTNNIHHLSLDNLEVLSSHVEIFSNDTPVAAVDTKFELMDTTSTQAEPALKRRKLNSTQTASANYIKGNTMDALVELQLIISPQFCYKIVRLIDSIRSIDWLIFDRLFCSLIVFLSRFSLVMSSRYHPRSILLFLLPFLSLSKNFVVHCAYREPLVDTFQAVRTSGSVVRVCLNESTLRYYQVLPSRTHPENSMSGSGGFLLSGTTVEKSAVADSDKDEAMPETVNGEHDD